jgi:8-oxo-dGTP pyrophosphatase MutT (NUDIX family)
MSAADAGVAIVVWRQAPHLEVLLLHRATFAASFEGDWAWTSPGGTRLQGESPEVAARRELREETGLELVLEAVDSRVALAQRDVDLVVFAAEAHADDVVVLSDEHDRCEWVAAGEVKRCLPAWVADVYREALALVPRA